LPNFLSVARRILNWEEILKKVGICCGQQRSAKFFIVGVFLSAVMKTGELTNLLWKILGGGKLSDDADWLRPVNRVVQQGDFGHTWDISGKLLFTYHVNKYNLHFR
jgi:hypothetical protein